MPDDPTADIASVMKWKPIVDQESKGTDPGDDFAAAKMRDEGDKVYSTNINVLTWEMKHTPGFVTKDEFDLAIQRWEALQTACCDARLMMQMLHYNEW